MATPNPSDATFFQDLDSTRAAESPAANFTDGMNRGGSCAPGAGIGTQAGSVAPPSWSLTDQDEDARTPQDSQHIGGTGFTPRSGNQEFTWDQSQALYTPQGAASSGGVSGKGTVPINVTDNDTDHNDTVSLDTLSAGWVKDGVA